MLMSMQTTRLLFLLLLTAFGPEAFSQNFSFAPKVDSTTVNSDPHFVLTGDLDGDGKRDIVVTTNAGAVVTVFRNTSTQGMISLDTRVDFEASPSAEVIKNINIGDIDGDGRPDLVTVSNGGTVLGYTASFSVLLNISTPGSIGFAALVSVPIVISPGQFISIGDIDGDFKPDVVVVRSDSVLVFRNTSTIGAVSFAGQVDLALGGAVVRIADIDGDGKMDIVVLTATDLAVFRNTSTTGNISFAAAVHFASGTQPLSLAVGDIDGDGKPDVAVANSNSSPNSVSVMRNTSAPDTISFAAPVSFTTGPVATANRPTSITIGDMDGDNKPELVVANELSNTVSVIHNTSTVGSINAFSFAAGQTFPVGTEPGSVSIGDMDGDSKPDLVSANGGSSSVSVLRQISPLSVTTISQDNFRLSPNPTSGSFTIENNYNSSLTLHVINLLGERLKTFTMTKTKQLFDISDLAAAIYLVQICDGEQTLQVMKVVKE